MSKWGVCVVCEKGIEDYEEKEKPVINISMVSAKLNNNFVCNHCIEALKICLDNNMTQMEVRRRKRQKELEGEIK